MGRSTDNKIRQPQQLTQGAAEFIRVEQSGRAV